MIGQPWNSADAPHPPRHDDSTTGPHAAGWATPTPPPPGVPVAPPFPYVVVDPSAPFGRTPTGQPYSERSKVVAGLLQIFLPGLGVGRFYLGHTKTGAAQLGLTVFGWVSYVLVFLVFFAVAATTTGAESVAGASFWWPFLLMGLSFLALGAGALWTLIDGVLILCDKVPDAQGRPLRA